MATLKFICTGRRASLVNMERHADLQKALSYSKAGARYTPQHKQWLAQKALGIPEEERSGWDGKVSMVKNGLVDVGLLLGAKAELEKEGFVIKILDWKKKPHLMPVKGFVEKDPKYEYQNQCVTAMLHSIPNGGGLVLSATGSGKTKIAAQFVSWIPGKVLFVVDQRDLLYQTQKEIQMWLDQQGFKEKIGIIGDGKFQLERVTVATIQTLQKAKKLKQYKAWAVDVDVTIIDELHAQMGRRNFDVVLDVAPQAVIGLTATMQLGQKPIRYKCWAICGPTIFEFALAKGVDAGVLSPGVVVQVPVQQNLEPRKTKLVKKKKEPVDDYVHEVVNNKNLHSSIVSLAEECLRQDLCVVILVHRVKHLLRYAKRLEHKNPKLFYGVVKIKERKKQLKKFDAGKEYLIIANQVFTKGINLKRIDVVIDGAQKSSRNDCIQKYGRAARLHAEKAGIMYFDFFTVGKMEKAMKARRGAFKKAKISIKTLTRDFMDAAPWSPQELLSEGDILLRNVLQKQYQKTAQGKLF